MTAAMQEPCSSWAPEDASERRLQRVLLKRFGVTGTWQDVWDWCTDPGASTPALAARRMRSHGHAVLERAYDGLGLRLTRFREEVPGVGFVTLVALTKQMAQRRDEDFS